MSDLYWRSPRDIHDAETALDTHKLFVPIGGGKFWEARRNGRTRTWKRDTTRRETPIKFGFRGHGTLIKSEISTYRIAANRQLAEKPQC